MHQIYASLFARRFAPALLWLLLAFPGMSQLSVGTSGSLTVANGTTLSIDSLVLIPSTSLTLSNTSIVKTPVAVASILNSGMTSLQRVYNMATPFTFSGTLGIMYRDSELGSNNENLLQLIIRQLTSGQWTSTVGSVVNTGTNIVSYVLNNVNLSSVTAAQAGITLPVLFSNLSAQLDRGSVLVRWDATSHSGISGFHVESSVDGQTWSRVGYVPAVQNQTRYSFNDLNLNFTRRYYRIAAVDQAGQTAYSGLVQVLRSILSQIRPLLTGAGSILTFLNGMPNGIELYDFNGRLMKRSNVAQTSYNIGKLRPGIYVLRYQEGAELHVTRLLID